MVLVLIWILTLFLNNHCLIRTTFISLWVCIMIFRYILVFLLDLITSPISKEQDSKKPSNISIKSTIILIEKSKSIPLLIKIYVSLTPLDCFILIWKMLLILSLKSKVQLIKYHITIVYRQKKYLLFLNFKPFMTLKITNLVI